MENFIRSVSCRYIDKETTLGIFVIEKKQKSSAETEGFDFAFLIVAEDERNWTVNHYEAGDKNAVVYIIGESHLRRKEDTRWNSRLFTWITEGKIIYDRNQYSLTLKQEFLSFFQEDRERQMMIVFAKLIKSYRESKGFHERREFLEAIHTVDRTLYLLARLSIIEKGYRPEIMLWKQIKKIDPEIYKLYEEFASNEESVDKRIDLIIIGIEFAVTRRATSCARHLIKIMGGEKEPWRIDELIRHPEMECYAHELSSIAEFLVAKGILEVVKGQSEGELQQYLYKVKEI